MDEEVVLSDPPPDEDHCISGVCRLPERAYASLRFTLCRDLSSSESPHIFTRSESMGRTLRRGNARHLNLRPRVSQVIENIRTLRAWPRSSIETEPCRQFSLSRFRHTRSYTPHIPLLPSPQMPTENTAYPFGASEEFSLANVDGSQIILHQYGNSLLHTISLVNSLLDGSVSRSLLISQAQDVVNMSLVLQEHNPSSNTHPYMFAIRDTDDSYRDMRLDVDSMSYEELLALEDRIGYVDTGLCDEAITSFLKKTKYFLFADQDTQKESCIICQEDYVEDEEIGKLDCGHYFHNLCIKNWLQCKNLCPVCKATGLRSVSRSFLQTNQLQ